ncbi:hypothetical protein N7488_006992 [Penicillium malachiteum]|nr:hypothetical protein N7488_006992 [Penicillium malachiteum]
MENKLSVNAEAISSPQDQFAEPLKTSLYISKRSEPKGTRHKSTPLAKNNKGKNAYITDVAVPVI